MIVISKLSCNHECPQEGRVKGLLSPPPACKKLDFLKFFLSFWVSFKLFWCTF